MRSLVLGEWGCDRFSVLGEWGAIASWQRRTPPALVTEGVLLFSSMEFWGFFYFCLRLRVEAAPRVPRARRLKMELGSGIATSIAPSPLRPISN